MKVVILGQDPYHDDGQAMGLSFSVPHGLRLPSSLRNIFKELNTDLGYPMPGPCNGSLEKWSHQGERGGGGRAVWTLVTPCLGPATAAWTSGATRVGGGGGGLYNRVGEEGGRKTEKAV